jgi:hypothetical protein
LFRYRAGSCIFGGLTVRISIAKRTATTPRKNTAKFLGRDPNMPFCIALALFCCKTATSRHTAFELVDARSLFVAKKKGAEAPFFQQLKTTAI